MTDDYDNLLEKAEELVIEVENVIQNYMEYNVGSCDLKNFERKRERRTRHYNRWMGFPQRHKSQRLNKRVHN